MHLQELEVSPVLEEMKPHFDMLAGSRKVRFSVDENLTIAADKDKLKQVLLNLFYNAVQHTDPEQGEIGIILGGSEHAAEIIVKDNPNRIRKLIFHMYLTDFIEAIVHERVSKALVLVFPLAIQSLRRITAR